MVKGELTGKRVVVKGERGVDKLYQKSYFGSPMEGKKLQLSLVEALYLTKKGKLKVMENGKGYDFDQLMKRAQELEEGLFLRYIVYKDLRERGYIVKTGLKYGAHFRIYRKGGGPGKGHGPFLVHAYPESAKIEVEDFLAKARVAHQVRKKLVLAIVDNENDVTYYKYEWFKP